LESENQNEEKKQNSKLRSRSVSHSAFLYPGSESNRYGRNGHRILSPACLPVPPPGHLGISDFEISNFQFENSPFRIETLLFQIKIPPTEGFLIGRRDSNPRPRPWQGRALPTELLSLLPNNFRLIGTTKVIKKVFRQNFFISPFNSLFLYKISENHGKEKKDE
jgi:hypothetical protein